MDAGVGHQVGLELRQVDVERPVEAEGGGDGGDHLGQDDRFRTSDKRSVSIQRDCLFVTKILISLYTCPISLLRLA